MKQDNEKEGIHFYEDWNLCPQENHQQQDKGDRNVYTDKQQIGFFEKVDDQGCTQIGDAAN